MPLWPGVSCGRTVAPRSVDRDRRRCGAIRLVRQRRDLALTLAVAEELVYTGSPDDAGALLTYFAEAVVPTMRGRSEERRLEALHASVLGHYEERRGNRARAEEAYLRAFESFNSVGFRRHAAIVAYRLRVLTGDRRLDDFIADALRDVSERYWVKARLAQSQIEARLTARQLEVVRLVAQGLTNKEIAAALDISFSRARNSVREILARLAVKTRTELASVAVQRGLLQPVPSARRATPAARPRVVRSS